MRVLYLKNRTVTVRDESDEISDDDRDIIDEHNMQLPRGLCEDCKRTAHGYDGADHCGFCRCCK